jgi:hypothetical protein
VFECFPVEDPFFFMPNLLETQLRRKTVVGCTDIRHLTTGIHSEK